MTRPTGKRVRALGPVWAVVQGAGSPVGPSSRISCEDGKPRSSDERRTIFPRAIGPRRWSRFPTTAIRNDSRRPPGGPGCLASARVGWAGWSSLRSLQGCRTWDRSVRARAARLWTGSRMGARACM
ncbi:MAG: hypothetical protein PHY05_08875 [Methanothrix sp.]|nr:hypothetical protein [Methanothrix sp.]